MAKKSQNKFKKAHQYLEKYCKKCDSSFTGACLKNERPCEFNPEKNTIYYENLYPFHPCKNCLVRSTCDDRKRCSDFNHYNNMESVAECELMEKLIYFTKNRIKLLESHPGLIKKENFLADDIHGDMIDVDFTKKYISEIKNDPDYEDILETERQYLEFYFSYNFVRDKKNRGRWKLKS